jgi:hypothetical protein
MVIDMLYEIYEFQRQFDKSYRLWAQDEALRHLIWYLNSGGRRSWIIVERPDEEERNQPRPDYICRDERKGGYITIEVTRISVPPMSREVEAFGYKLGYEVAKRVAGKLDGTYSLVASHPLDVRGIPLSEVAQKIVAEILSPVQRLTTVQYNKSLPFGLKLLKIREEGSELLPLIIMTGDSSDTNLVNYEQITEAIRAAVAEASVKLRNYSKGDRLLLLVHGIVLDYIDFDENLGIPCNLSKKHIRHIDKCYALMDVVGLLPRVLRLW